MTQTPLFDPSDDRKPWQRTEGYPLYDGTPPHEAPSTSHEAAASITHDVNRLQAIVLRAIGDSGPRGLTDDELELRTGLKHQTASARRRELYLLGRIRSNGQRPTRSGRMAKTWIVRTEEPTDR